MNDNFKKDCNKLNERLKVNLGKWQIDNPIIPASGTFGFGYEFSKWYDINILGSISIKGTTKLARFGNPTPRIAEAKSGILNSIGLQNPGVEYVINYKLKELKKVFNKKIIANVAGSSIDEYLEVATVFDNCDQVAILEINLSCPNVNEGGMIFGNNIDLVTKIVKKLKKNLKKSIFIKLSPNTENIVNISKAAEESGADGLVLINCMLGTAVNPRDGSFIIKNKFAGLSGPCIKPVALRIIYEVYKNVNIPIIGVGGIESADDVIEFMSVGASAIEVGSANLIDPFACYNIIFELKEKMDEYGIKNLSSIIGRTHKY